MIARVWRGYTTFENADAYHHLLKNKIFPYIEGKRLAGYRKIELFKQPLEDSVEFITIMYFDSLEAVKKFAGSDYEVAVVLPEAQSLLTHYDARSQHYEILESLHYKL